MGAVIEKPYEALWPGPKLLSEPVTFPKITPLRETENTDLDIDVVSDDEL